ncbi:uncharacterized protein LOC129583025 [Paramacrobiotus metropolitanus]|uniref:uncharacterized protein LOC129583025 n=1 Tax=Paramacrobiotus metropolitanus TaxID=2943436 RepID=UPI00244564F5|nr:uncharacterized protein LOC129583025 [Paramacrobiotus metropolitanus]XP_055330689.1 uncharacterized protein LOC129583025 [Paramacrobiotus metropolitanus]XP_055330690.1 uncharacterized protein LOC129583025 [Paramacrobiotus metropolitanus]XP_055330691.1 uncharacterized protein LOC129583025 [Paramacrobiotus metropolitanus]
MTEVVDAIPTLRRRMDAARRLTSSQENVVISSTSSIRNRGKRSRSVSLLSAATKKRLSNGSLEQDLHVSMSSVAMGKVANDMEKETDCTAEIHSLWHWLRQVEKHLYADAWPEDLGNDEASLRQELEHYLVVHGTIENLVSRLNQAKDNLSQRNSAELPVDFAVRLRHLETRLHQCWLKSLERQLRLEEEIHRCSLLDFDDPENRSSSSESCLSEPALRCWDWSEWDLVHCASAENMSEEKGVMAGTAGQGLSSLKLALNLASNGKLELVSQDIGYASESSTLNLSMDDVSPSQPLAPVLGNTGAVSGLIKTLTASPGRVTPAASAHSDTDSSRKADARRLRLPLDPAIRNGSLSASPNEFYYKVAPLILDARAEVLTRSAKGSLSKLRAGPALAFTDDEGESKNFQLLSEITAEVTVDPPKRSSLPTDSFTTPPRTLRARTLPPEDRTALLASQCTPQPPETLRRKPRRRRPWSLHLQDPRHGGSPGVSAAVSESALAGQALPGMLRGGRQRRGVVVDWSGSSSEGGLESEEDLEGSRLTVTGRGARGGIKSQSMSALGRRRERGEWGD